MEIEDITLQLATRAQETPLVNLLELYLHDMSAAFPIRISEEGRFGYAWLPMYWAEPDRRFPYLIWSKEGLMGFVLATIGSTVSDDPNALEVAEFFVLRRFRRSRVGSTAIRMLWDLRPGHWVVRVSEGNPGGVSFWPHVVRDYTGGDFIERRVPGRHYPWHVFELHSGKHER
jgi:predicted acetyltransferase